MTSPAPLPAGNAEARLKRQIQWLLFLRVAVLTILLGLSVLLQVKDSRLPLPPLQFITTFIAAVYAFTILSGFLLNLISCYRRFAFLQVLIDIFLVSVVVFVTGGSESIFIVIYFFPVIAGGVMLYRQSGLAIAAAGSLAYGLVLLLEYLNFRPFPFLAGWKNQLADPFTILHHFTVPALTFFLVSLLSGLLSERLRAIETALSRTTLNYDRLSLLYKQIFDDITSGIITVDNHGAITSINQAAEDITGFRAPELLGRRIQEHFPDLRPETDMIRPVVSLTRKDGRAIPIGYSWARLNMPDSCDDCRLYTFQDLSNIKKMEDKVRQAEKMAAIGEMAAGIAHEFRNPLTAISGAAQVLAHELDREPGNQALLNIIVRECDRLEETISEFLQFSKPAVPEQEWFSLAGLLQETIQLLKQGKNWQEQHTLRADLPPHLDCWADPRQVKQVLWNLLSNACQAMGNKQGQILVAAREYSEKGMEYCRLTIADSGPGIPATIGAKIFEPFFTTRENGTGLGLAIVRQILQAHQGDIRLEENSSGGAIFTVLLPLP